MPSSAPAPPIIAIGRRVAIAIAIVLLNWGVVLLEREGYQDSADGDVSVLDALYYTTVTLSTTGYGDITPVTDGARLTNALLVTPMRLLFVLVLVGTTIQVLTERSRAQFQESRWRSRVKNHVVVCGYGTKGRSAVRSLIQQGIDPKDIVVIDSNHAAVSNATAHGLTAVHGSTTDDTVLQEAMVDRARSVIVAVDRDDAAVLTTLTVRQLNPGTNVVAAVREEQNADLLTQSGADSVITSSDAAGRLLGIATHSPQTVAVIEDLLAHGHGLDLLDRTVAADEVGAGLKSLGVPVLAVIRGGQTLAYGHPETAALQAGDRIIYVANSGP